MEGSSTNNSVVKKSTSTLPKRKMLIILRKMPLLDHMGEYL